MENNPIRVELFTIPQAACDSEKANWNQVAQMVSRQLKTKFGDVVDARHIEFMSGEWFTNQAAQQLLEKGGINFPFVLVNGEIACADKKINLPKISKAIESLLKNN
ncbi:MAG: hypothetical protein LC643_06390 [Bacteroidales bacterium]|nr:hypothetical protein [Bacteroidales bacterium]